MKDILWHILGLFLGAPSEATDWSGVEPPRHRGRRNVILYSALAVVVVAVSLALGLAL